MRLRDNNQKCGATGYVLLWLSGIPISIFASDLTAAGLHVIVDLSGKAAALSP
jgi:hypothetical protein